MATIKNSNGEVSMRMKTTENPKSSGWLAKVSRVLIFTMMFSIAMPQGWYNPTPAQAALSSKQATFVKNTAAGAQAITGLGFQPKAIIFYWTKQTATGSSASRSAGYGFAAAGAPITMAAVSMQGLDNVATTDANNYHSDAAAIVLQNTASGGAVNNLGTITAFGADGFTVSWSAAGQADRISYIALGGTDITNAKVGTTSMFALTGNSSVTGVGFQPDTAFLLASGNGNVLNTITASSRTGGTFAFMSGTSGTTQGSVSVGNRDARTATGYIGSVWSNTDYTTLRATALDVVATLGSWDADGFTMNATAAPNAAHNVSWLALKGGKFRLGSLAQPAATGNQSITGVGFQPLAVMFASANLSGTSGTLNTTAGTAGKQSIGAAAATQSGTWTGSAGTINSGENMYSSSTAAITHVTSATVNAQASLSTLDADGFTLNWTTADATARNVLYIAIGSATPACAAVQPTGLALGTVTASSVGLTWTTNAANNYYNVYRNGVKISTDGAVTTGSYTDNTVTADTAYSASGYTVTGYNTDGLCESVASTAVAATTASVTPIAPTVSNPQLTTLDVAINAETPANPSTTTYAIRINGGAFTDQYVQAGGTVGASAVWQNRTTWATKTVTGLANGTTYTFDVQARNQALTTTVFGTTAGGTTLSPCAAGTPTGLTVGTETTSLVPLTWTGAGTTDYFRVYRGGVQINTDGATTTGSYNDSSAIAGTTYSYTVSGYNTSGTCESSQSTAASAYTLPVTPTAPTVANFGDGVSLNVTLGADTNAATVQYAIRINGGAFTNWFVQADGTVAAGQVWQTKATWSTIRVTGLTNATTYTFTIIARNSNPTPDLSAYSTGTARATSVTLPSTITSCSGCHGYTAAFTDGTARNNPTGAFIGDHTAHVVKVKTACTICHVAPEDTTSTYFSHRTGTIQMQTAIAGGSYSKASPFAQTNTPTTGTCSTISCHGGNTPTPQWGVGTAGCVDCHKNVSITRTKAAGTLDPVVGEFGQAWGHKKTGRGAVTDADCIVCHLEGDFASQQTSGKHADGYIDLRNPDGVGEVAITNMTGGAFLFTKFSTTYVALSRSSTGTTLNTVDNVLTQKFCLACHDNLGATNTTARAGTSPSATAPFGGGFTVLDAKTQFALTNSSRHPVLGPRNADYPTAARLANPYKPTGTRGSSGTRSLGVVMNCFDCHNAPTVLTTRTVAAHGNNTAWLRGTINVASPTLCTTCHLGYIDSTDIGHNTVITSGSAFGSIPEGRMTTEQQTCNYCHADTLVPVSPAGSANVHGTNVLPAGGATKTLRWNLGTAQSVPIAFIRNTTYLTNHQPRVVSGTTYAPQCSMTNCTGRVGSPYTPGGTY